MVEVDILDFMGTSMRTFKQALRSYAGSPEEEGLSRWKRVAIHCYRCEDEHRYRETENGLACFSELRDSLELHPVDVPDFTTINKSFDRFEIWVWRAVLRVAAKNLPQSGFAALESTFFDCGHASAYYRDRAEWSVETLKVTTLTDTESLAILYVHCYAQWRHNTKAGPQVVRRNADDLEAVGADNGFRDWHTEWEYYTLGVEPLILCRGSSVNAVGNNAVIRERGYTQGWMAETS